VLRVSVVESKEEKEEGERQKGVGDAAEWVSILRGSGQRCKDCTDTSRQVYSSSSTRIVTG